MKRISTFLLVLAMMVVTHAQTGDLPRSTPAQQGLSTQAVSQFVDSLLALPQTEIHHVMVARHGQVVAEAHPAPFRADDAHTLYSASKTFVSLAVGLAIADNRLRLDDRVAAIMHDHLPDTISTSLAQMTVRNLLTMSSGIKPDWTMRNNTNQWLNTWLAYPVKAPGEHFFYDSMATYMLSAIVQRVMGKTVLQLLCERIFEPLHITEVDWEISPEGINTGGWGMRIQAESLAKVGILMLQRGQWEGRQLVPEQWIDEMTQKRINYDNANGQAPTDGNQGYCYQLWRCKWPTAYRMDGAHGQFVVMDPASDIVVVILGRSARGHDELACIWNQLMPGVDRTDNKNESKAEKRLAAACSRAALPLPQGKQRSNVLTNADFKLQPNPDGIDLIKFYQDGKQMAMRIYYRDGRDETIPMAYGKWTYGHLTGEPPYSIGAVGRFAGLRHNFATAAAYAWTTPGMLTVQIHYVNWISATTLQFDITAGTVQITHNYDTAHPHTIPFAIVQQ